MEQLRELGNPRTLVGVLHLFEVGYFLLGPADFLFESPAVTGIGTRAQV